MFRLNPTEEDEDDAEGGDNPEVQRLREMNDFLSSMQGILQTSDQADDDDENTNWGVRLALGESNEKPGKSVDEREEEAVIDEVIDRSSRTPNKHSADKKAAGKGGSAYDGDSDDDDHAQPRFLHTLDTLTEEDENDNASPTNSPQKPVPDLLAPSTPKPSSSAEADLASTISRRYKPEREQEYIRRITTTRLQCESIVPKEMFVIYPLFFSLIHLFPLLIVSCLLRLIQPPLSLSLSSSLPFFHSYLFFSTLFYSSTDSTNFIKRWNRCSMKNRRKISVLRLLAK